MKHTTRQNKQRIILLVDIIKDNATRNLVSLKSAKLLHIHSLPKIRYPPDPRLKYRTYITAKQLTIIKKRYQTWYFKNESFEIFLQLATQAMKTTKRYI